ncbi:MAG: hypothetical protein DHS20C05_16520 [Hyphococcus sp.]|nr:MAG: hypothetical protein DHS20C05_16520 [Marinicaulis sp.]
MTYTTEPYTTSIDYLLREVGERSDPRSVATQLAKLLKKEISSREHAAISAAVQGNRFAGLENLTQKYSKLKTAFANELQEQLKNFPVETVIAACTFAGLDEMQARVVATWASSDTDVDPTQAFPPFDFAKLDRKLSDDFHEALWPDAPVRDRARRISEMLASSQSADFNLALTVALITNSSVGSETQTDKIRGILGSLWHRLALARKTYPHQTAELISSVCGASADERSFFLMATNLYQTPYPKFLETLESLPEGFEEYEAFAPIDVSTCSRAVTKENYAVVATNETELTRAIEFGEDRKKSGIRGSLIYLSLDQLPANDITTLKTIFETFVAISPDINWYLENPELRRNFETDYGNLQQSLRRELLGKGLMSEELCAFFDYATIPTLFYFHTRAANLTASLRRNSLMPTQLIFLQYETAVSYFEKMTAHSRREANPSTPSGVLALTGVFTNERLPSFSNYQRLKMFFERKRGSFESSANLFSNTASLVKSNSSKPFKRLMVLFHPGDAQYTLTARALASAVPEGASSMFSTRDLLDNERTLLDGVPHQTLITAISEFSQRRDAHLGGAKKETTCDEKGGGDDDKEANSEAAVKPIASFEDMLVSQNIDANANDLAVFAKNLEDYIKTEEITHALFVPERPANQKLALTVLNRAGVVCANVESSIFGDTPTLGEFLAPRQFVVDPVQKEILHRYHNVDEDRIDVSGPVHDYARGLKPQRQITEEIFAARRCILLCTQSDSFEKNVRLVEATIAAFDASGVGNDSDFELVIRPHPSEAESRRQGYMALPTIAGRKDIRLCDAESFKESVEQARFVVTRYSTVLYDARYDFAIPIAVNLSNDPASIDFIGLGICLGATSVDELASRFQPQRSQEVLATENSFRERMKSGIDNPARHILNKIGIPVRDGEGG